MALCCVAMAVSAAVVDADECGVPGSGWVFCTGFEEGDLALWDDWDGNPAETNELMLDEGPLNEPGNHVMRLKVPPGSGSADLTKVLPGQYDVLYARWYILYEPGFDFTTPQHGGGLHAGDRNLIGHSGDQPDGSDWFSAYIEPGYGTARFNAYTYYRGMYMNCVDPNGSCWGDDFPCMHDEGAAICTEPSHRETTAPPLMEAGRWYCIEMMFDAGTPVNDGAQADGVLDYWIDGVEIGPWDDLWLRTTGQLKVSHLWLSLFFHDQHDPAGVLLDDIVVSTERIGPRDPQTPAKPTRWGDLKSVFR